MARMTGNDVLRQILAALEGLRFGSVEIVVHDGRIVQLERREKVRMATEVTPPRP
ncbi:MAG: YezD family protein [Gemmatimonadetes bacterium]|nr:YezD family protein [Gemmatimonadota bacterium]